MKMLFGCHPLYVGLHAVELPPSHGFMPPWGLSDLLFLQSHEFFSLETCSFFRLSQKTLALILLASGRRIHEISSLSTEFRRSGDEVVLYWPEGSKAKCYRVGHYPEDPSIRKRSHFLQDLKILGIVMWKLGRCTHRRALVTNASDD